MIQIRIEFALASASLNVVIPAACEHALVHREGRHAHRHIIRRVEREAGDAHAEHLGTVTENMVDVTGFPVVVLVQVAPGQAVASIVTAAPAGLLATMTSNGVPTAALVGDEVIANVLETKLAVTVEGCTITLLSTHVGPLQAPLNPVNV